MRERVYIAICSCMVFFPWTILPLRTFPWALETPAAQIIIVCYAAFMIFSGGLTLFAYKKRRMRGRAMQICLVCNCAYAAFGILALIMMGIQAI